MRLTRLEKLRCRMIEIAEGVVRRSSRLRRKYGLPRVLEPSTTRWHRANRAALHALGVRFTAIPDLTECVTAPPLCLDGEPPPSWAWARRWRPHERFLVEIPRGELVFEPWRCASAVVAPGPSLLHDAIPLFFHTPAEHPVRNSVFFSEPRHLPGRALLLFNDASTNFYHWCCDILPRLLVASQGGRSLAEIDHFITDELPHRFHHDSLEAFGIPREKLVVGPRHRRITADVLCVPSLYDRSGMVREQSLRFVRDAILPDRSPARPPGSGRRIFVSRQRAHTRRIVNWEAVAPVLREFDFEDVFTEELTLREQAGIFDQAGHVVGVHGAGLTNLMFCRPGTRVLEILDEAWGYPMYWLLSARLGLDYAMMHGRFVGRRKAELDDLEVDADVLRAHLRSLFPPGG